MHRTAAILSVLTLATAAHAQVAAQTSLGKRLPEIKFDQVALTDAMEFFRDTTDANFVVDWKALQEIGISKETPVSLRLRAVATAVGLRKTLDAAAPGLLAFYIDTNVIHVTTRLVADNRMFTRVYSVADLVVDVPNFTNFPRLSLDSGGGGGGGGGGRSRSSGGGGSSGSGGGGGGGGAGGSLFGGAGGAGGGQGTTENRKTMTERGEELVSLIQDTIRPDIWTVNGGKAAIRYSAGRLIVTAPLSVHEAIGGS